MANKKKIFLAHAKEDSVWVRSLYDFLEIIGVDPWMAPDDITPGEQWPDAIRKVLQSVDFVVACLSRNSIEKRGYVQREFRMALDLYHEIPTSSLFLIPLRLSPCEVPDLQVGTINLRSLQWVDAFASHSLRLFLKSLGLLDSQVGRGLLNTYGKESSLSAAISLPMRHCYGYHPGAQSDDKTCSCFGLLRHERREFEFMSFSPVPLTSIMNPASYIPRHLSTSAAETGSRQYIENDVDGSELVVVPGGEFMCGDRDVPHMFANQLPNRDMQQVFVQTFAISQYLVTNGQYTRFLGATAHCDAAKFAESYPLEKANHPVVNVSWRDAQSYCQWAGGSLPSEYEWEKAARGIDGRPFPWGWRKPHDRYCNFGNPEGDTNPVNRYVDGVSPYGCFDCAGNVWEWCSIEVTTTEKSTIKDSLDSAELEKRLYIVKGGSYHHGSDACRCGGRYFGSIDTKSPLWGFRLAMDLSEKPKGKCC